MLTDRQFFQGSLGDLEAARAAVSLPVLRKDFTLDEFHVIEAAAHGADAILLIAALLEEKEMRDLRELAAQYRMAALVEVHDASELEAALGSGAEIVGVNNRNLHTFEVTLETSLQLAEKNSRERGEGQRERDSFARRCGAAGRRGLSSVPGRRTPDEIRRSRGGAPGAAFVMVKVCGITRREDAEAAVAAGASAIGFVFVPTSPRYVSPETAAELGRGLDVWKVGVFDQAPEFVEAAMRVAHLDIAQVYGELPNVPRVWRALRVGRTARPPGRPKTSKPFSSTAPPTVSPSTGNKPAGSPEN